MNVVIVTEPDDIHAVLVKLALEKKGCRCDLFFSADMPSKHENSIYCDYDHFTWITGASETDRVMSANDVTAVWWRRPRKPFISDDVHKNDRAFIVRENSVYHHSIPFLFNDSAWWVNPYSSQVKSQSKIVQLKVARQCGFALPLTLISNSPHRIKDFIKNNEDSGVIYKPFTPYYGIDNDGLKILYTNRVCLNDLPSDKMLKITPGIYQRYVDKKYELRVTCFGRMISAVKIDSQSHRLGKTDWRRAPAGDYAISKVELPEDIKERIILFMNNMGIVFGCFDFIVTKDDDYIFLEVNEQGQFLWVEDINPQCCYLDMFADYLIQASFDFNWVKSAETLHSADFTDEAQAIVDANVKKHVYLNGVERVA